MDILKDPCVVVVCTGRGHSRIAKRRVRNRSEEHGVIPVLTERNYVFLGAVSSEAGNLEKVFRSAGEILWITLVWDLLRVVDRRIHTGPGQMKIAYAIAGHGIVFGSRKGGNDRRFGPGAAIPDSFIKDISLPQVSNHIFNLSRLPGDMNPISAINCNKRHTQAG